MDSGEFKDEDEIDFIVVNGVVIVIDKETAERYSKGHKVIQAKVKDIDPETNTIWLT